MNAPARKSDPVRNGLIGKIHVAKAQLRLDTDTYRDVLKRVTGKESSADCSLSELEAIKAEMVNLGWKPTKRAHPRAGKRPLADGETAAKLRALWISGYHLGVVRDPAEAALASFVQRVTGGKKRGVSALQWMLADDARKAIEALKAMLGRMAGVKWSENYDRPRRDVVWAQYRILDPGVGLDVFLWSLGRRQSPSLYTDQELDALIEQLGAMIRAAKAKA